MAVGTTQDSVMKRNRIVELALRAVKAVKPGEALTQAHMRDGVLLLNEILREEDQSQTGKKRSLWALSENHIFLVDDRFIYGASQGLPSDVQDPQDFIFRDTSGDDHPISIVSQSQYEALTPKDERGDPECVLFVQDRVLSSQTIRVWPIPNDFGTTSEVTGTDALNYSCVKGHTSSSETRPITGASYSLFWKQTGSSGSTWVTDTAYTNGALVRLSYKRPLFDFDLADNDPDLPSGWGMYLRWRLSLELAANYRVSVEDKQWMERMMNQSLNRLFPATVNKSQKLHNYGKYY